MTKIKFSIVEYWENKVNQNVDSWGKLFEGEAITRDTVIVNPVILNSYSDSLEDDWCVFPDTYSVLGFLKYIFLPTVYIGIIKDDTDYQYYLQGNLNFELNEEMENNPTKASLIKEIQNLYEQLKAFWALEPKECFEGLKSWSNQFNKILNDENSKRGIVLSFHVFKTPKEVVDFVIEGYEDYLGIDSLEDDLGITKNDLLELVTDDIYENEFMKRRFTDILTNRLKVTF